jgi:hypothetical protein
MGFMGGFGDPTGDGIASNNVSNTATLLMKMMHKMEQTMEKMRHEHMYCSCSCVHFGCVRELV